MSIILPIDDALFSLAVLHEAGRLVRDDPASLTHRHLQHVAVYSSGDAIAYARKRDEALARRTQALEAAVVPAPQPAPQTFEAFTSELIELLADALKQRDDTIKALDTRLAALEQSAKTQADPSHVVRAWPAA